MISTCALYNRTYFLIKSHKTEGNNKLPIGENYGVQLGMNNNEALE